MRIFNRIVVVLLLAGIVALGVTVLFYLFDVSDYHLEDLSRTLGLNGLYDGANNFVQRAEGRSLDVLDIVVLALVALLGLVLLILEFKPPSPRRVRMHQGTYVTRRAVEDEVNSAVEGSHEVLQSNVKVKAQRRTGARVNVTASVRPGENAQSVQADVQDRVQQRLDRVGIPIGNLSVQVRESDPRQTKTRVK